MTSLISVLVLVIVMKSLNLRPRAGLLMLVLLLPLLASSCAIYRNDRCYVEAEEYSLARDIFIKTGSIDLVKTTIQNDLEWETCKVNETIYRLTKEFEVLPEDAAATAGIQPPAPSRATPNTRQEPIPMPKQIP